MEPRTHWSRSNAELRRQSMQPSWHQSPPQACDISLCTVTINHLGLKKNSPKNTKTIKGGVGFQHLPPQGPTELQKFLKQVQCKAFNKKKLNSTGSFPTFHAMSHRGAMAVCCLLRVPNWPSPTRLQPAPKAHLAMCQRPGTCGALAVPEGMTLGATDRERVNPLSCRAFATSMFQILIFRMQRPGCKDHLSHLRFYIL